MSVTKKNTKKMEFVCVLGAEIHQSPDIHKTSSCRMQLCLLKSAMQQLASRLHQVQVVELSSEHKTRVLDIRNQTLETSVEKIHISNFQAAAATSLKVR